VDRPDEAKHRLVARSRESPAPTTPDLDAESVLPGFRIQTDSLSRLRSWFYQNSVQRKQMEATEIQSKWPQPDSWMGSGHVDCSIPHKSASVAFFMEIQMDLLTA